MTEQPDATAAPSQPRWWLEVDGHRIEVEADGSGWKSRARLLVDGEQVDERSSGAGEVTLRGEAVNVKVSWGWRGEVRRCVAHLDGGETLPLRPPPGTRAAQLDALADERPVLYAARHVAIAGGKLLLGLVGFGLIVRLLISLLPDVSIDPPDIPLPSIDLPRIPLPSVDLPDITLPAWLQAILEASRWWMPLLIAIAIGWQEVRRRRRRVERERAARGEHGERAPDERDGAPADSAPGERDGAAADGER
ncbi:hypothetical protein [Conexibacter arvalis]|uniref:Uncharacterized protein n=1 Tax=Conexibacter arvalis TaxID=912552 RepID=A0A840ID42_9ACTN|nr:hypothetical protein [Conexibacter arvalis]MBB4662779.1 hypothetical protein [Conexibacter arvalis]